MEQRLYHSVCLLLVPVLLVFIAVNMQMGLWPSAAVAAGALGLELLFFTLSRHWGLTTLSIIANAILTDVVLVFNYKFNSGIDGPTISLLFLTLVILLMATQRHWHKAWVAGHLLLLAGLYAADTAFPGWAPYSYRNGAERRVDHLVTYVIVLLSLYLLTRNLQRHYRNQRHLTGKQAAIIRQKNEDLLRSEGQLQAFFQNAAHGHILFDQHLSVLAFNREASLLFQNCSAHALQPGQTSLEALPAGDSRQLRNLCQRALRGERSDLELALPQRDGGISWWRFSAGPARHGDGSLLGVVLSAVSIQERVQHEAQLRAQGATLVQIAHLHAHSLRGPAASILGLVKLVRELGYQATPEDMLLLQEAAEVLDARIHEIVALTGEQPKDSLPGKPSPKRD